MITFEIGRNHVLNLRLDLRSPLLQANLFSPHSIDISERFQSSELNAEAPIILDKPNVAF